MVTFSKDPHHYTPVAMGEDIVQMLQGGQRIKGKRHYGAWYQGRIYLFATQENYNAFTQRPSYFADFALKLESAVGQLQVSSKK
jgi:YHS domain-containing protein